MTGRGEGVFVARLLSQEMKDGAVSSSRSGGWKSELQALAELVSGEHRAVWFTDCISSVSSCEGRGEGVLWGPFNEGTGPSRRRLPPKGPPPRPSPVGSISTDEFGAHRHSVHCRRQTSVVAKEGLSKGSKLQWLQEVYQGHFCPN